MTIPTLQSKCMKRQDGMTLLVALIFLMALSMLGIWGAANNALQERMSGNTRNRDLAFEAAEAALYDAENTVGEWHEGPFNGTDGLFAWNSVTGKVDAAQANDYQFWRDTTHWNSYRFVPVGTLNQVAEPPRYLVEFMDTQISDKTITETFRVTARGVGADSNAVVILQSIITYTYSK